MNMKKIVDVQAPKNWYKKIFNIGAFIPKKAKQMERRKHTGIPKGKENDQRYT